MPYGEFQNNAFELANRKRKRQQLEKYDDEQTTTTLTPVVADTCFTNAAYSSTPKKLIGRRRKNPLLKSKENSNPFLQNTCLEVKSIADIVLETQQRQTEQLPTNPYEVVRKPPKKKKRQTEFVDACFENPALNLELPEKQFNPYEVHRESNIVSAAPQPVAFVNAALNLRVQDTSASRNPFEIQRCSATSAVASNPAGVENLAMKANGATNLKIGLPFPPSLGCRIDFKNMQLAQLTPSKLLAEKLVFSPVPGSAPKRSLGAVSEESSMDIGRELDRYQLELENSINEAKLRKNFGLSPELKSPKLMLQVELEQKITFTQKLGEIKEGEEEEESIDKEQVVEIKEVLEQIDDKIVIKSNVETVKEPMTDLNEVATESSDISHEETVEQISPGFYASDSDEDELDFKAPAPFVRAYRRAAPPKHAQSKESLNSNQSDYKSDSSLEHKNSLNVKNLIRKSIRKLIHPHQTHKKETNELKPEKTHTGLISSIRHSLRRKPFRQPLVDDDQEPLAITEISIIDSSERTMKLKTQSDCVNMEQLNNEKKHSIRNSIRRSTREIMKTVFHKHQEEYAFSK